MINILHIKNDYWEYELYLEEDGMFMYEEFRSDGTRRLSPDHVSLNEVVSYLTRTDINNHITWHV